MPLMPKKQFKDPYKEDSEPKSLAIAYSIKDRNKKKKKMMASGGMIDEDMQPEMEEQDEHHSSIAAAIMSRRQKMAEGGMVDLEIESEETPADASPYDDQNMDAAKKELYDDSQLSEQPVDSNEHGDMLEDEDLHDMVSSLRKKIRAKRGM